MYLSDYVGAYCEHANLKSAVAKAVKTIRRSGLEFDSIAVRGNSGLVVGAPVALALGKELIIVRKDNDHHSELQVEGYLGPNYIIIDDFVETGATLEAIADSVYAEAFDPENGIDYIPRIVGVYLYTEVPDRELFDELVGFQDCLVMGPNNKYKT